MARLALINPLDDRSYYRPAYPSVGLSYLSSFLKSGGFEVLALDAKFDGLSLDEVRRELLDFRPDILGFSAMTHEITNAARWAEEIKKAISWSARPDWRCPRHRGGKENA